MAQRNYRDPLHDIISLDERVSDDRLIVDLIDTPEFQRLRRIKQLGLAMFTYQGAEHSRFTHSIGVMHLMTRVLDLLAKHTEVTAESRVVGRAAALLHDLGHGPFSHVIEKVFHFHHESWSRQIILDSATAVNHALSEYDEALPEKLAAVYDHNFAPAYVSQLVSSQLDCDRMDYLLRDSLMTGAKYGVYDLEWVLHALKVNPESDQIYVEAKGLHAVEEYLQARYYMFRQVYFHRTLRSAEAVLVSTLNRARELLATNGLRFRMEGQVFERMLMGEEVTTQEYLQLDDTDVTFHLKQWMHDPDPILSDLASRFIDRRLFKAVDIDVSNREEEFVASARSVVARSSLDPDYYLIMDRAADTPYYGYYTPFGADPRSLIYVETAGRPQEIKEISEVSDVVRGMRGYRIDRVCFPAELSEQILSVIESVSKSSV